MQLFFVARDDVTKTLQRYLLGSRFPTGSHSMYRISLCSTPTVAGVCLAGLFACLVSCSKQSPPTGATLLDDVSVSSVQDSSVDTEEVTLADLEPIRIEVLETGDVSEAAKFVDTTEISATHEPILRVSVSGAKSTNGVYFCALFDHEEKLKQRIDPVVHEKFPATESEITWEIESLPPGRYSIAAFHDVNENGKVDRHALGYPTEAYGFSNNARGKFGPPPYEKIEFEVGTKPAERTIQLK